MSIQLITFDLDDTLWDVATVMHGAEAALREWLALQAPKLGPVPIEHLWAIRARLLADEPGSSTVSASCAGASSSMHWKRPVIP